MSPSLEVVKAILGKVVKSGFGQCLKNFEVVHAEEGFVKAKFIVTENHLNLGGSMHGGFTCTVVDCVSSWALVTYKNSPPGVSVDLSVTYMKPAFLGETVTVDAKTVRVGKKMAFLTVELTKNDGKDIIAQGRQTKYIGQ